MPTKTVIAIQSQPSLVDRLIDSQTEWRHLIREANGGEESLRSLSETQIKRQEVIHELVQTERHHCLTLALMRQVYLSGLRQLNEARSRQSHSQAHPQQPHNGFASADQTSQEPIDLERLFPALEELVQAHELFFAHLRLKLVESCQKSRRAPGELVGLVGSLGDLLREQFRLKRPAGEQQAEPVTGASSPMTTSTSTNATANSSPPQTSGNDSSIVASNSSPPIQTATIASTNGNGHKLLQAYAKFCGAHTDSSKYYKHLMRTDKGFKQFVENCNKQRADCRQRGIPECNLLVTQRLTKYPLLIEQLIKSSKDDPEEEAKLRLALAECKTLLDELNQHLARKESFERLLDIYAQFCPKSYTLYNGHLRFTKHDLLQHKRLRQLLHSDDQVRIWSATRRKLFQVLCLILDDIIVFIRIEAPTNGTLGGGAAGGAAGAGGGGGGNSAGAGSLAGGSSSMANFHHHRALWPMEPPIGWGEMVSSPGEQQASRHHQHHHSLIGGLGSQCALINVVANAIHSAAAQHLMHQSATPNQSGANSQHQQQAQQQHQQQDGINVRYYFANIDNKSSVISLGKLIIRDKAARDEAEPRTYLISSSPRQPEMYELAFVSRRHQANFMEKLKACIEQHNKNVAAAVHLSLAGQPTDLMSMDFEDVVGDLDYLNNNNEDDEFAEGLSSRVDCGLSEGNADEDEERDEEEEDGRGGEADEEDEEAEEFDSGRGHDDSSSTSSNSAPKSNGSHESKADADQAKQVEKEEKMEQSCEQTKASFTLSSSSAASSSSSSSDSGSTAKSATNSCEVAKCPQANRAAKQASQMKLRKLSTVSTMSSHLKLLTQLRNSTATQGGANTNCCHCSVAQNQSRLSMSAGNPQEAATLNRQIRRFSFIPEQKMEELRDLKLQLEQDKKEWQLKFERMQEQLLNERHDLDLARERLRQDQHEVANEREQLYRKLDVLKEKGILLSPSHKVIITTPELRSYYNLR